MRAAFPWPDGAHSSHTPDTPPRAVAEIEGFVNLLAAACNDSRINATLERLLAISLITHHW